MKIEDKIEQYLNYESTETYDKNISYVMGAYRVDIKHGQKSFMMFPNYDTAKMFVDGKITGLNFKNPKFEKEIPIKINAKYRGQDEQWTERPTGSEILDRTLIGYHFSSHILNSFRPKVTSFYKKFPNVISMGGYYASESTYAIVAPKGTKVIYYDDEFRVNLQQPGIKMYKVKQGWLPYELSIKKSDNDFIGHRGPPTPDLRDCF